MRTIDPAAKAGPFSRRMARRTHLKPEDTRLLEPLRGQQWTVDELRRLTHLDARTPTLVIQEIHPKLIAVSADAHQRYERGAWR